MHWAVNQHARHAYHWFSWSAWIDLVCERTKNLVACCSVSCSNRARIAIVIGPLPRRRDDSRCCCRAISSCTLMLIRRWTAAGSWQTNKRTTDDRLLSSLYLQTNCIALEYAASRYDTRCYFNVRSKANMSQLNLPWWARSLSIERHWAVLRSIRLSVPCFLYSFKHASPRLWNQLRLSPSTTH